MYVHIYMYSYAGLLHICLEFSIKLYLILSTCFLVYLIVKTIKI